jgi:hypothetical protein
MLENHKADPGDGKTLYTILYKKYGGEPKFILAWKVERLRPCCCETFTRGTQHTNALDPWVTNSKGGLLDQTFVPKLGGNFEYLVPGMYSFYVSTGCSCVWWNHPSYVWGERFFPQQDGVNRLKKAMQWQDRCIHMKIPNLGKTT